MGCQRSYFMITILSKKNKRIEDQKLNGLKMNLRILTLNSSKFKNRGLFNFRFLPLTSKKF